MSAAKYLENDNSFWNGPCLGQFWGVKGECTLAPWKDFHALDPTQDAMDQKSRF